MFILNEEHDEYLTSVKMHVILAELKKNSNYQRSVQVTFFFFFFMYQFKLTFVKAWHRLYFLK